VADTTLKQRAHALSLKVGATEDKDIAAMEAAFTAERQLCADIMQLAREGEIDRDLRSIIHRIKNP